jgi:demethylmenaquinone methyltransferase / 2-methoxy-6-polyprenyl-1,4-benzoquinol methylase
MPDPSAVHSMFGRIARRYDVANLLLSGGIDRYWRSQLVAAVLRQGPSEVLDLATGSGDVAFALSRKFASSTAITGMDFCQPMLDRAQAKKAGAHGAQYQNVTFRLGDVLALPLADESFDAITIAFGLRNLANRAQGLSEMRRVLRPGGVLYVLEFSQPDRWLRPLYYFYLRRLLPRIAGTITGNREAYIYLNETIGGFPDRAALAGEISGAGFSSIQARPMTFGIVALHEATK